MTKNVHRWWGRLAVKKKQLMKGGVSKKENLKIFLREEKVNFCEWDS